MNILLVMGPRETDWGKDLDENLMRRGANTVIAITVDAANSRLSDPDLPRIGKVISGTLGDHPAELAFVPILRRAQELGIPFSIVTAYGALDEWARIIREKNLGSLNV